MAKNVKVYGTSTCPYCIRLRQFLKDNNVEFEDRDISRDPKAGQEIVEKTGQMGVPVVDIEGEIIVGFDQAKIRAELGL